MNKRTSKKWDLIINSHRGWFELHLNEIWFYCDLLLLFVKRDFTTFYKQTILGPIWFFIQPLLTTIVFTIIFNRVAKIPTNGFPPYLFYMSGIIAWNYFSNCITTTSDTFTANANLFGKVYFPRIIVPFSKIISGLTKFGVQLILFIGFYLYYMVCEYGQIKPSFQFILLLPVLIIQMGLLGQGIGMLISSLTTKYRDLNYLLSFGIQLLMYASPIIYPLSIVPDKYRYFILANPITPIIEGFRQAFLYTGHYSFNLLLYSFLLTCIIFLTGLLVFNKVEKNFIDTI